MFSRRLSEAKAIKRRIYVSALLLSSVELQFCFIMILKSQYVCSVLRQKHKQSGCEGKCRSPWNSFTVSGVTDASVCYFRRSLESGNVKHISNCICKSLHPLFAKFPLKKETLFAVIVHNIQTRRTWAKFSSRLDMPIRFDVQ